MQIRQMLTWKCLLLKRYSIIYVAIAKAAEVAQSDKHTEV